MLSCKEITRLISESMDRDLPMRQRMELRFHLLMCKFCSRYKRQLQLIEDAVHRYSKKIEDEVFVSNHALSKEARQRIKHLIRSHISSGRGEPGDIKK